MNGNEREKKERRERKCYESCESFHKVLLFTFLLWLLYQTMARMAKLPSNKNAAIAPHMIRTTNFLTLLDIVTSVPPPQAAEIIKNIKKIMKKSARFRFLWYNVKKNLRKILYSIIIYPF